MSADDVTGSMIYIESPHHKILLDCGMHQTNDRYEDFKVNNRRFKEFKPKDIDHIFISHSHIDHLALLPKLVNMGFSGEITMSLNSIPIARDMLLDCANINERDILIINSQHNKNYKPLYETFDVYDTLELIHEYDTHIKYKIDDELSFELIPSGHLLCGVQIILYFTVNGITKKIGYTGDLGNKVVDNKFVGKYEQIKNVDLLISEATYGDRPDLKVRNKERKTDLKKLKSVIDIQIKEMGGRVILPSFSQSRAQVIALMIYQLYKNEEWKPKVYIDSPLTIKVFKDYSQCLIGEEKLLIDEIMNCEFFSFVNESEESKVLVSSNEPCLVISSSGMCDSGRVRHHIKKRIPDPNTTILFVGYSSPNSLGGILKDPKRKTVTIDQKEYKCRCSVQNLRSLSGHAPFDQLIDNYASVDCQKVILHHGSKSAKETLKIALEKELENRCKTTRVICSNSSLKFTL